MRHLPSIPLLRIILPFILGILFYHFLGNNFAIALAVVFVIGLFGALGFQYLSFQKKLSFAWLNGLALTTIFIALGFLISFFHSVHNQPLWYQHHNAPTAKLKAKIASHIKSTERTYKATVDITGVYENNKLTQTHGAAILYFQKGNTAPDLKVNDEIVFVNKLQPILAKGNPGEFDYAAFSNNRSIFDQAFLTQNEWQKIPVEKSYFENPFPQWHEKIKEIISENIPDQHSKGIALALITGYRDDIDKVIYSQYSKTGLVHLLAISGLHMGIFYLGTLKILGCIPFFKKRRRWLIIGSLIIMWLFALVTTFPPSVQRASVMFTFLGIGQLKNRRIPSVNFLFGSAFVLLLLQPHLLFEVGFQLSYAAVLGILLFYTPLRDWYFPSNKATNFIWEIMCLSLTAQIFTFPIAIYYFHQLPLLFLITNLVAIPVVTGVIYAEVFLVLFCWVPYLPKIVGWFINGIIKFLNHFIDFTSSLSFVSIQNIYISLPQCFLLIAIMGCLAAWLLARRKLFAPIALILFLGFMSIGIFRKGNHLQQNKLIVYNANTPYLEIVSGENFYTNDTVENLQAANFEQYITEPTHLHFGIRHREHQVGQWQSTPNYDFISVNDKSILRLRKAYKLKAASPIVVDYLIISDKWLKNGNDILVNFKPKELIIDGNIPLWKIEDIKSQLREVDLPIHYIGTQGAKIIEL